MTQSIPRAILWDSNATRQELERVLHAGDAEARALLARRRDCPPEWLQQLARDDDQEVVYWATINPNTPVLDLIAALWRLSHGGENARCNAAKHEKAPIELLERLSTDEAPMVRALVLTNPNCPERLRVPLLEQLIEEPDTHWLLLERLDLTPEHLRRIADGPYASGMNVAAHPNIPQDVVHTLASHPDPLVRRIIAARSDCPRAVLNDLAMDEEPSVGVAALLNPTWPAAERNEPLRLFINRLLEALDESEESEIWAEGCLIDILTHPNTPPRARHLISLNLHARADR